MTTKIAPCAHFCKSESAQSIDLKKGKGGETSDSDPCFPALDNLLAQPYPSLELVICDDSADSQIADLVDSKQARFAIPVSELIMQVFTGPNSLREV
ncbi:glycosyltransferase family A protein [Xanthomonas sp. WHRI 7945]|nr:glycosyltransferase family A protein [Xanthomonas campestris pv. campestris]